MTDIKVNGLLGDGEPAASPELEALQSSMKKVSSTSRFQVARVDFSEDGPDEEKPEHKDGGIQRQDSSASHRDSFQVYIDTTSPNATYHNNTHKTFGKYTTEALPHVDHYRNLLSATNALKSRPTLAELHEEKHFGRSSIKDDLEIKGKPSTPLLSNAKSNIEEGKQPASTAIKFGWIKGVLIRCLLNIWGVMLFLRLSWVTGQAGVGMAVLIVLLSTVVTVITSVSMSAICTNGEVKGGGAYFMISRSLGPEFGGAIGLIFSVANAVAVAMYVVGFAETVRDILKEHDALMIDEVNDIRIVGVLTVSLLLLIAIIGMEWEARAQMILLVALLIALLNFFVGTFIPPTQAKVERGITGYSGSVFVNNLKPQFTDGESFFSVFAIFFPAATGILAGANISGDLKNPQKDIPRGTILAIIISSSVYILTAIVLGATIMREIPLKVCSDIVLANSSIATSFVDNSSVVISNCTFDKSQMFGLLYDFQAMEKMSGFGPLITIGIFSATLSSALASLVSAPKVFQAVCKDKIFPKIDYFAKGYGVSDNPRRAYILTYFIGVAFVCIGDLNAIAPIISNFFLMSYTLINYAVFDSSLARSPGWRPAFRYYSMWISLLGALLCTTVMFIINWWTALITFGFVVALFVYVHHVKPDVNWGSSTQAHVYKSALQTTLKLNQVEEHVKNYRPQILVLTGLPKTRPALVDFVWSLSKKISLMICGHVVTGDFNDNVRLINRYRYGDRDVNHWLYKRKVKAFYSVTAATDFRSGVQALMLNTGVGKLRPNVLLMGFMSEWRTVEDRKEVEDYFNVVHDAFDLQMGVAILRVQEGFTVDDNVEYAKKEEERRNKYDDDEDDDDDEEEVFHEARNSLHVPEDSPTMLRRTSTSTVGEVDETHASTPNRDMEKEDSGLHMSPIADRFSRKMKKGTIDVWWLFDDGGLTLLLPYILTTQSQWSNCKLRIFTAGTKRGEIDREQRQLATLLSKFRIDCKDMFVLPEIAHKPQEKSVKTFEGLLEGWMLDEENGETKEQFPWKVSEEDVILAKEKTQRNIRLSELLKERSAEASLIVMTLPMPRKATCPAGMYMAWLDILTTGMPPILLLRGNQTSVLTFYS